MRGRTPVLDAKRLSYLMRAERIRARLSRKTLAARWGVSLSVLSTAVSGLTSTIEEHDARYPLSKKPHAIKMRRLRRAIANARPTVSL